MGLGNGPEDYGFVPREFETCSSYMNLFRIHFSGFGPGLGPGPGPRPGPGSDPPAARARWHNVQVLAERLFQMAEGLEQRELKMCGAFGAPLHPSEDSMLFELACLSWSLPS